MEERRLRDEEKQKAREAKVVAKVPVEGVKKEDISAPLISEPEPPVLEPIPHVASIAPTEKLQVAAEEPKATVAPGDVDRIDPTFIPMSEMDEITASQANLGKVDTEESELEPVVTAESGLPSTGPISGDAEEIARRVFASPVENESSAAVEPSTSETIKATSNVEEAPVVKAETATVPAIEAAAAPPAVQSATKTVEPPGTKPDAPVATRVAPAIAATAQPTATTETTVSGPSAPSKAKESKGVSSWLKTKFRRASKSSNKLESTTPATDSNEKGFVGGASLTAPETTRKQSSDHGDSSMREVAMAGKDTTTTVTTSATAGPELSPIVSPNDEDLYSASTRGDNSNKASGTGTTLQRQSTSSVSISSLSSDEDTRGRSSVPRDRAALSPMESSQQPEQEETKSAADEHIDPSLPVGGGVDPTLLNKQHSKGESSSGAAGGGGVTKEEFEEARDTFDEDEKLAPPDKSIVGGGGLLGRKSDSPARDSKFIEEL